MLPGSDYVDQTTETQINSGLTCSERLFIINSIKNSRKDVRNDYYSIVSSSGDRKPTARGKPLFCDARIRGLSIIIILLTRLCCVSGAVSVFTEWSCVLQVRSQPAAKRT